MKQLYLESPNKPQEINSRQQHKYAQNIQTDRKRKSFQSFCHTGQ